MILRSMLFFLYVLLVLHCTVLVVGEVWTQGDRIQLSVNLISPLEYNVSINGFLWLQSAPIGIFLDKQWHTEAEKTLKFVDYSKTSGTDQNLGAYNAVQVNYIAGSQNNVSVIFTYFSVADLFYFETSFPNGASGTALASPEPDGLGESEFNSTSFVSTRFPSFVADSESFLGAKVGFYEWHGRFSADSNVLATGINYGGYQGGTEGGPLLLFNTSLMLDRSNADALFISGFSHFKDSIGSFQNNTLSFGVQGYAESFPSEFVVRFGLCGSQYGINAALDKWGANLRKVYPVPKIAPELDPINHKLSYWTDNGAYYYGGYWSLHQNTTAESVLLDLYTYFKQINVPVGSIQLDPWWYPMVGKTGACQEFDANTKLFPHGLDWLHQQIPIPLLLYSSYWAPTNAYAQKFEFLTSRAFDLPWDQGQVAVISPSQSEAFYNYIMDLQAKNLGGFEIDFMDFQYLLINGIVTEIDSWRTYLQGSALAALAHNVSIQYCMELPNDIIQSVEFASVTSARASEDDFPTNRFRWAIGFTSMLHRAVGLGPFFDNFWTTSVQPGNPYGDSVTEPNAELATIISTLSAGPVGLGDGIGYINMTRIMRALREDGVILKPSVPAIPIDSQFVHPYLKGVPENSNIWSTYSQIGKFMSYSLLVVNSTTPYNLPQSYLWPPVQSSVYWVVANIQYQNGTSAQNAGLVKFTSTLPFAVPVQHPSTDDLQSFALYTIAPIFTNGWSILGETSKIVTTSPVRVQSVDQTNVVVQLLGAPNESVQFTFVSPSGEIVIKSTTLSSQGTGTLSA